MSTRSNNDRDSRRESEDGDSPSRNPREQERQPGFSSMPMVLQPPAAAFGGPSSLSLPKPVLGRPTLRAPKMAVHRGQKPKTEPQKELKKPGERWNVSTDSAPEEPWFPLENTARIELPINVVAEKIDVLLQERSVFATFDSKNAVAKCITSCYTSFHVNLFIANDDVNEDVDGSSSRASHASTIVEIQRRKGCPMIFAKERRCILDVLQGVKPSPMSLKNPIFAIPDCLAGQFEPRGMDELKSTLERISIQLLSPNRDVQLMTIRNLACMTNPETSFQSSCENIAKIIVESDMGLRETLASLINGRIIDQKHAQIRNGALNTIVNIFVVLVKANSLEVTISGGQEWFNETLLPLLIEDIKNCDCIHNACLSSKCLGILLSNSEVFRAYANEHVDLLSVLEEAVARGAGLHQNLHSEAQSTLNALQCQ
jgi:hypothetical protein